MKTSLKVRNTKAYFVNTIVFWKKDFAFSRRSCFLYNFMTNKCTKNAKSFFQNTIVFTKYAFVFLTFKLVFIFS